MVQQQVGSSNAGETECCNSARTSIAFFFKLGVRWALSVCYLLFVASVLCFLLVEAHPAILELLGPISVPYYAIKANYVADDQLVLVRRARRYDWLTGPSEWLESGDLFGFVPQSYQVAFRKWPQQRPSYTKDGFRRNSSIAPFHVAVVGDSFIEIGESERTTFSEQLKDRTGLSIINLGLGWYGPYQYLEIIKRYIPLLKPKIVIVALYAGNDIQDIQEYEKWQQSGQYYSFGDQTRNIIYRYYAAMRDLYKVTRRDVSDFTRRLPSLHRFLVATHEPVPATDSGENNAAAERKDAFGFVKIGSKELPMVFYSWKSLQTSEELLQTGPWQSLERIMMTVKSYAQHSNARVIWLLIPTKEQVYGPQTRLSDEFKARSAQELNFEGNFSEAFHKMANRLEVEYLDLLPVFRRLAPNCILYYPTDTHWNIFGRRVAANMLSRMITKSETNEAWIEASTFNTELCGRASEYYN
jgi:hypothetical protein